MKSVKIDWDKVSYEFIKEGEREFLIIAKYDKKLLKKSYYESLQWINNLYKFDGIGSIDFIVEHTGKWEQFARSTLTYVAEPFRKQGLAEKMYIEAIKRFGQFDVKGIYSGPSLRVHSSINSIWDKLPNVKHLGVYDYMESV